MELLTEFGSREFYKASLRSQNFNSNKSHKQSVVGNFAICCFGRRLSFCYCILYLSFYRLLLFSLTQKNSQVLWE